MQGLVFVGWIRPLAVALLAAILAGVLTASQTAYALSCAPPPTPVEEWEYSAYVFRGEVTGKRDAADGTLVTFEVRESWKGTVDERIELYEFTMWKTLHEGQEYLVYASEHQDGRVIVNGCGRTALWDTARDDITVLQKAGILPGDGRFGPAGWIYGTIAAAVVAGAAALYLYRYKGRQRRE